MNNNQIKPPIGTANSGYEYKVEIKPPYGEVLVTELKKIGEKNKARKKAESDGAGGDVNFSNQPDK